MIVGGEGANRITGGIGRQLRALLLSPFVSQRLTMFLSREHFSLIEQLADHLGTGSVVPVIGQSFELAEAPEAIRLLAADQTSGKTAIVVRGT